jgi:hypothetical protein
MQHYRHYRHYRLSVVGRNRSAILLHLALAVLLVGGWTAVALGLPVQAMSIVAEDETEDAPADETEDAPADESEDAPADESEDAPADDREEALTEEEEEALTEEEEEALTEEEEDAFTEDEEDAFTEDEEDAFTEDEEDAFTEDKEDAFTEDEEGAFTEDEEGAATAEEVGVEVENAVTATLSLDIAAEIGAEVSGSSVNATASGLLPGSRAILLVFSSPQVIGEATADADGNLSMSATLPSDLPPGEHTVVLQAVDVSGAATELATGISISEDGTLSAVTSDVSTKGLAIPVISSNPKVPAYPAVVPLDAPAAVAAISVAALTIATVAGVGAGIGGGSGRPIDVAGVSKGPSGEGVDIAVRSRIDDIDEFDAPDLPVRSAAVLALAGVGGSVAKFSPLLSRTLNDAAPVRAFAGGFSLILPLAALLLGIFAAISVGGRAEPAILALMIPLLVIGVLDAFAGLIGALAFAVSVAVAGGIVNASSVRTLIGVGLIMVGPGLIAGSFRDIRRRWATGPDASWERLTDLVVVPLIGAWITIVIVSALPDLGAIDFPIADQARLLGLVALIALVAKVLLEQAAARKVPARMFALSPTDVPEPGTTQQVSSTLVRTGAFLFISAAFVGNVWQLWVAALLFLLPSLLSMLAHRFKNFPALWQVIPEGVPLFAAILAFGLIVTAILSNLLGDVPDFAQMSFLWMAVPGFVLALIGLFAREPNDGDARWYNRPSMTMVYRIGGVIMLIIAIVLASRV